MTTWLLATPDGLCVAIASSRWFDARAVASCRLLCDPFEMACMDTDGAPDLEIVWRGNDAGATPNRRMEVIER